jgi:hypothetical protein
MQRCHKIDNSMLLHSATICEVEHNLLYYVLLCCVGQRVKISFYKNTIVWISGTHIYYFNLP